MVIKVESTKSKLVELEDSKKEPEENAGETSEKEDIQTVIKKKINSIAYLRGSRVHLSKRLESYSRKWKFIFFSLNIEAVIIVLLSLTNTIETIQIGGMNIPFDLIAGIFTLYVILLQYYVNVLNYNERALRVHYHQLELEDLNQQLAMLSLRSNTKGIEMREREIIDNYEQLVAQYQLAVKNNENHWDMDFERTKYEAQLKDYDRGKSDKKPENKRLMDTTLDIALIYSNAVLSVIMFLIICGALIF